MAEILSLQAGKTKHWGRGPEHLTPEEWSTPIFFVAKSEINPSYRSEGRFDHSEQEHYGDTIELHSSEWFKDGKKIKDKDVPKEIEKEIESEVEQAIKDGDAEEYDPGEPPPRGEKEEEKFKGKFKVSDLLGKLEQSESWTGDEPDWEQAKKDAESLAKIATRAIGDLESKSYKGTKAELYYMFRTLSQLVAALGFPEGSDLVMDMHTKLSRMMGK